MSSSPASLFSDWLQALGVRHTCGYSDRQYARMPFRTLFGLSKLLQSYGVDARGYAIADKGEIAELKPPFVAQTQTGDMVIVERVYPNRIHDLALINACCLPYTVWSITYQRFVAHHWCTLCVGVQATLWLLFFCYLFGGSFSGAWPPHISFFALGAVYVAALLVLSKYSNLIKYLHDDNDSDTGSAETD